MLGFAFAWCELTVGLSAALKNLGKVYFLDQDVSKSHVVI